jgi:hypothetical protein
MRAALLWLATSASAAPAHPAPEIATQKVTPMDDTRFWSIIEASAQGVRNQAQQEAKLRETLAKLTAEELVTYQATYDAKRAAAYSWDLWGAAYVIHGGASDDGFDYFRSWLISRGRTVFERALVDSESVAEAIPTDTDEPAEFESLTYVAIDLWAKRTGRPPASMPVGGNTQPAEPTGNPWSEDELAARYPKLWERFGDSPLD